MTRGDALVAWYWDNARDLPWRKSRDPYRILVSEVMLQQTQVSRVVPAFARFVATFPSVESLASAPLAAVLDAWSGLGYNTRARRLREAARAVVANGWPATALDLQALPGVGPYTAAAVASIAFGERVAVHDTNVRRVLTRWTGRLLDGAALRQVANAELDDNAATWNQAMMELGALVCRPKPRCGTCPVARWCAEPTLYVPPRRQTEFRGSHREVRGAVVRALRSTARTPRELALDTGHDRDAIAAAIESLTADGLIKKLGERVGVAH